MPLDAPVTTIVRPASGAASVILEDHSSLLTSCGCWSACATRTEAAAALAGGADIIDAKEPLNGALGPGRASRVARHRGHRGGTAPVSVALGDVGTDDVGVGCAGRGRRSGVSFVKVGFAGARGRRQLSHDDVRVAHERLVASAALMLVAYADYERADAPSPDRADCAGRPR